VWLRWFFRTALAAVLIVALATAALLAWSWRSEIAPADLPSRPSFEATQVRRGATLAAIGNCNVCHTKEGGAPYTGGRRIATPFGDIYSTNITPDSETGIGRWTEAAFTRAMREGVSRDGHNLYPAFPYDHMTKMRDDDIKAVYAFIMARQPVHATKPENNLEFPFNQRALAGAWRLLFLVRGVYEPDRTKSEEWNRGAYLVEGLAHCGACHTPRNLLGAERNDEPYAGGESEGWIAPALNGASPAAVPWTAERLYSYFREGQDALHGVAAGPMAPVVRNLRGVPDTDVRAIALYVADLAGAPSPERQREAERIVARTRGQTVERSAARQPAASGEGAQIYAGACAQCHGDAGRMPTNPALNLALSTAVRASEPANLVRIVLDGIHPAQGSAGPLMPGFGTALTDGQITALADFVRANFSDRGPWSNTEDAVRRARQTKEGS
jgi:mono/diheme cytochrome c family protein